MVCMGAIPPRKTRQEQPSWHLLPERLGPAGAQARRVPPAALARGHQGSRQGPPPTGSHLPDDPAVLPADGGGGPPPADRPQGLRRHATAQHRDPHQQAQRPGLPPAQGGQVPPPKKVKQTDAIFANVEAVHEQPASGEHTLRLSLASQATTPLAPFCPRAPLPPGPHAPPPPFTP